jgi:Aminoglycoside-2''-adenylyltransferase
VDAPDYAFLWPWEPIGPRAVADLLEELEAPWWIAGGCAVDLFLGRETRRHDDFDVALLRSDQGALFEELRDWDLYYATPGHTLEPWDGHWLESPIHGIWGRRSNAPNSPWTCEFLLNEQEHGNWVFRRNQAITRPLEDIGIDIRRGQHTPFRERGVLWRQARSNRKQ